MTVTCAAKTSQTSVLPGVSLRQRVGCALNCAGRMSDTFIEHRTACWGKGAPDRALGAPTGNAVRTHLSAKRRDVVATPARQRQNTPHGTARQLGCEDKQASGLTGGHHVTASS